MPLRTDYSYVFQGYKGEELIICSNATITNMLNMLYGSKTLKRFFGNIPNTIDISYMFNGISSLEEFNVESLPKCTTAAGPYSSAFNGCKNLREFHTLMPALKVATTSSSTGMFESCSKLSVCSVGFPALNQADRMFYACILDKASAIIVLNSLPSYNSGTHVLGIGIHVDHQQDEEVLAAIANAEAKGWALTVQWNGTATSTASVMRFGQLIYAKVVENERPDGTTERVLDWGHYVTNPEGYETFRSLESAYEYFGLPAEEGGEE